MAAFGENVGLHALQAAHYEFGVQERDQRSEMVEGHPVPDRDTPRGEPDCGHSRRRLRGSEASAAGRTAFPSTRSHRLVAAVGEAAGEPKIVGLVSASR